MLMVITIGKIKRLTLLVVIFFLHAEVFGSNTIISGVDAGTYTVNPGMNLSIVPGGQVLGNIRLNGGTIINNGVFNPAVFTLDSGTFYNYSEFYYDSTLYIFNHGIFFNLDDATVRLSGDLKIHKNARYLSDPTATLLVNVSVVQMGSFVADAGSDQTVCQGAVVIGGIPSASMGVPPYAYSWSPATALSSSTVANPTASPTTTTTYTLTASDARGLNEVRSVTINVLGLPTANAGSALTICMGSSVTLGASPTASGGASPYLYVWDPIDSLNYDTVSNPTAKPAFTTPYTVTVIDANNCSASSEVNITVKSDVFVFAGNDTTIANRDTIVIGGNPTASFGVPPFTYSWSPSGSLSSSTVANPSAYPTANTSYTVTVSDASGCASRKDTVYVEVDTLPHVDAGPDYRICLYDTVTIGGSPTAKGGVLPLTYSWSPSGGLSSTTAANPRAYPTDTTVYVVTVTDNLGYFQRDTMVITVNPLPTADAGLDSTIDSAIIVLGGDPTASGGVPPYNYHWYVNDELVFEGLANPGALLSDTTTFIVVVTDSNNCQAIDTIVVNFDNIFGSSCNCDSCDWIIDHTVATSYTINSGQKLCIRTTGVATGTITVNNGGTICNSGQLTPAAFTFNGGRLINNSTGIAELPSGITLGADTLVNDGEFTATGNITANLGAVFSNSGNLETQGKITVGTTNFYNYHVITLNAKNVTINASSTVNNYGSFRGIDSLKNSGTLNMGDSALIFTSNYFNYASAVTQEIGPDTTVLGGIMVCARSENAGTISDSVDICDKSPSAGPVYLDANTGTVASGVTYCQTEYMLKYAPEGCGSCPSLTLVNDGCAGDIVVLTASSTKQFDNYEFYRNDTLVQNSSDSVYVFPIPAVLGDDYYAMGTSFFSPCKTLLSNTLTILSTPTVTVSGYTIAVNDSVTLTASGASSYIWYNLQGDSLGAGATKNFFPDVTTLYIAKGTNSSYCSGVDTFELHKKLNVDYTIQPASYFLPYSGEVSLTVGGGKYPFTYAWNTGSTLSNLRNVVAGTYSVIVTDASGQKDTAQMDVGVSVDWASTVGVSTPGNSVIRTAAGDGWAESGSFSANVIGAGSDGWVEFVICDTDGSYMIGLGTDNTNGDYTEINYAVNISSGSLGIYESGVEVLDFSAFLSGVRIRIERNGSNIIYKKNGTAFRTTGTNSDLVLRVITAIHDTGAAICSIQGSFSDYSFENLSGDGGSSRIGALSVLCSEDMNKNFVHTITYDEDENVVSDGKVYFDYLGRQTQTQTKMVSDNDVLATQTVYDAQGRAVLQTLAAPIGQTDLCYKDRFISNTAGANYSVSDFDIANYSSSATILASGEVDKPKPVSSNLAGGLGWYYSKRNTVEPYVPSSSFPYARTEYDDNNRGDVRRTASPGEYLNMGSGHEKEIYKMTALNELDYLYGENLGWIVEDYSDASSDGQGTIDPAEIPSDHRVTKTISVDENDQEMVVFNDLDGKVLVSCLSGQVNGSNISTRQLSRIVSYVYFVDVHLPKGCESSLTLTPVDPNSLYTYNILNLKTGKYVKFPNNSIDFIGTQPNLPPGLYRIKLKGNTSFAIGVAHTVNYYNFTVNYYDLAGRLKLVVPPSGVDPAYTDPSTTPPNHKMISSTNYNSLGWVISTVNPDEGKTEYLYRDDGQIRFSQNSRQRASSGTPADRKFSYVSYDDLGRPVQTGEYNPLDIVSGTPASFTQSDVTATLADAGCSQEVNTLYDVVDANSASYTPDFLLGKVAKTWNDASTTWYSYDELGRMTWTVQEVEAMPKFSFTTTKTLNYEYDMNGNVTEVAFQKEDTDEDLYHYYEYDADQRLKKAFTSMDAGATRQKQAEYFYYKHGPLKRTELAGRLQGIDYVYTINGWLKSMNAPELNQRDPGKDGYVNSAGHAPKDLFGMTLDYFAGDYVRSGTNIQTYDTPEKYYPTSDGNATEIAKNMYNGLIKDQRWQTQIPLGDPSVIHQGSQLFYGYLYDTKYQLTNALFGPVTASGTLNGVSSSLSLLNSYKGPRFTSTNDYKVFDLSYDLNGNIKTLKRNGHSGVALNMDQLQYCYNEVSGRLINNKLKSVEDAISANSYNELEFQKGAQVCSTANYVYDESGQQIEDNSTATPAFTEYDVYGKVTAVYEDAAKTTLRARFTYDDRGFRIKKFDGTTDTWYIRDASGNALSVYSREIIPSGNPLIHKELAIFGDKRLGIYNVGSELCMYELSDHLGNVRTTFIPWVAADIQTDFDGTGDQDYLFTYNSNIDKNIGTPTAPCVKTTKNQKFGTGIYDIPVKTGQVVSGTCWYKTSGASVPAAMLALSLADATDPTQLLDWVSKPVTTATNSGSTGSGGSWAELAFSYTVVADGLLGLYPRNNDKVQTVWFDDLDINFSSGGVPIADQNNLTDYYPHGSILPGRNYIGTDYRHGYQGQFSEKDPETNKNSFQLRDYDALLGRWMRIDPYGQLHSPYLGMGNNPINIIDHNGGDIFTDANGNLVDMPGCGPNDGYEGMTWYGTGSLYSEFVFTAESPGDFSNYYHNTVSMTMLSLGFAIGGFPNDVEFAQNSPESNAFRNSDVVRQARDAWYKGIKEGSLSYKSNLPDDFRAENRIRGNFGATGLLKAGLDPLEQFVGSFNVSITSDGTILKFTLTNVTGIESATYGVGTDKTGGGSFSNFKQTFIFTESINFSK